MRRDERAISNQTAVTEAGLSVKDSAVRGRAAA